MHINITTLDKYVCRNQNMFSWDTLYIHFLQMQRKKKVQDQICSQIYLFFLLGNGLSYVFLKISLVYITLFYTFISYSNFSNHLSYNFIYMYYHAFIVKDNTNYIYFCLLLTVVAGQIPFYFPSRYFLLSVFHVSKFLI